MFSRAWRYLRAVFTLALPLSPGVSAMTLKTASILLATVAGIARAAHLPDTAVAVHVSVHNFSSVGKKTLANAEQLATAIFASAGVNARWTTGSISDAEHLGTDFTAMGQHPCPSPLDPADVRVQLLPHAPKGFPSQALGYSLPC